MGKISLAAGIGWVQFWVPFESLTYDHPPAVMDLIDIEFKGMFPKLEHHGIRYALYMCGLRDIPSQSRLIEFKGIELVEDLAKYIMDSEIDAMADCKSKWSPANTRVQFGLVRTKNLKAIAHWVRKKAREGITCDLRELTPELIPTLITEINANIGKKESDSKLYCLDALWQMIPKTG